MAMPQTNRLGQNLCTSCNSNTPRFGEEVCGRCLEQLEQQDDMNRVLLLIRDETAGDNYRFDAIADALDMILRKI
jgi:hypothetical protein